VRRTQAVQPDDQENPMQLLMVRFEDRVQARMALVRLEEASDEALVDVADAALVYRTDAGELRIDQPRRLDEDSGPSLLSPLIVRRVGAAMDGPEAVVFVAADDDQVSVISQRLEARLGAKADYLVLTEEETAEIRAGLH
jgi:hypothetical protein